MTHFMSESMKSGENKARLFVTDAAVLDLQ